MRFTRAAYLLLLSAFVCLAQPKLAGPAKLPSPKDVFGFNIGDDYQLVSYAQMEGYWKRLAEVSPRMKLVDIGPTSQGRRQWMAIISSPSNLEHLDEYKNISSRLAHAEGLTSTEAHELAKRGKAVVWIDGGLHASETVGAQQLIETYRARHGLFAVTGIMFNHESAYRPRRFVTRKITDNVAKIALGQLDCLMLGNIDAKRDWGFAREYVEGMWRMMQADQPDTYVLATGRTETVRNFVQLAFKAVGRDIVFSGEGEAEVGIDAASGKTLMRIDPRFYRPAEVDLLIGDASYARDKLGWAPQTSLEALCDMMVKADLRRNEAGASF